MSDYKTLEQVEFAELFEKLKGHHVNAVDIARELQTTPQAVSMWNKGKRNPRPLALEKLRAMAARICGDTMAGGSRLRESGDENDAALWRRRAKAAEAELAKIKETLRRLASNSKLDAILENHLEAEVGADAAPHKPRP